jgi:hypothetical protein
VTADGTSPQACPLRTPVSPQSVMQTTESPSPRSASGPAGPSEYPLARYSAKPTRTRRSPARPVSHTVSQIGRTAPDLGARAGQPRTPGGFYGNLRSELEPVIESDGVDLVLNPYAPGAGRPPSQLAGRGREIGQFQVEPFLRSRGSGGGRGLRTGASPPMRRPRCSRRSWSRATR